MAKVTPSDMVELQMSRRWRWRWSWERGGKWKEGERERGKTSEYQEDGGEGWRRKGS